MLNYPSFLKEVDRRLSCSDTEGLKSVIHEIARRIPEKSREQFLEMLGSSDTSPAGERPEEHDTDETFAEEIDSLIEDLKDIQAGSRKLASEYNEEWDDWRDDEEDEYDFSDPSGILDDIGYAVDTLHQCLDLEAFEKGLELAKVLSVLEVSVTGDGYFDNMKIRDLVYHNLLDTKVKTILLDAVCLALLGTPESGRAEEMLAMMDRFGDYSVSLEEILQASPYETDTDALLPSWMEALAERPEKATDRLLIEALHMLPDRNSAWEAASRYAASHPALYLSLLQSGKDDAAPGEMLQIGLRGIREVPVQNRIRSRISLLTAEYALAAQERETAEKCWLEAIRTAPTPENYLRLRVQTAHWKDYAETVRNIYTAYYPSRNSLDQKPLAALLFLDERFEEMMNRFMKAGSGIGWSGTFMKEGIALMLLLLDCGKTERPGISAMWKRAFQACIFESTPYSEIMDPEICTLSEASFQEWFKEWKNGVVLEDRISEEWLRKIEQWLELRVGAIMDANRRNYYGECAAFVAAYGEVLESRGQSGEKGRILQQYRLEYPRRRAFHDELRRFGMR